MLELQQLNMESQQHIDWREVSKTAFTTLKYLVSWANSIMHNEWTIGVFPPPTTQSDKVSILILKIFTCTNLIMPNVLEFVLPFQISGILDNFGSSQPPKCAGK